MKKMIRFSCVILLLLFAYSFVWAAAQEPEKDKVCFAISAMISPERTFSYYQDFLDYLEKKFEKKVVLKQRRTYQEVNDLLETGAVDCAFICTGAYVHADQDFRLPIVAVPLVYGKATYHSYVIVSRDSPYHRFDDLKGKVFAFTDDLSNSGALYPQYLIGRSGSIPEDFYSYFFYTHSHDKSVEAVARGIADGAAVDSLVYDYLKEKKDPSAEKTRIIDRSEPFGIPPVVASPKTTEAIKSQFRRILLTMHSDPEGKTVLDNLKIDRFVEPPPGLYDSVRKMSDLLSTFRKNYTKEGQPQ